MITRNNILYALGRNSAVGNGQIYKWTGNLESNTANDSWTQAPADTGAFAIAAGRGDTLYKVNTEGTISCKSRSNASWVDVEYRLPAKELAVGKNGRLWILATNTLSGQDNIAFKDGAQQIKLISGPDSHITANDGTP